MCEMKKWMAENRRIILVSLAVALAAFGVMLTCNTLAIDEEKSIIAGEGYSVWIAQGRFMIQLFNEIFTVNGRFVPFLWDLLAVLAWFGSGVILAYSLPGIRCGKSGAFGLFWFLTYYGTLPFVVGEVLSFSMYSFQVALGAVAAAVSFYLTVKLVEAERENEKKTGRFLVGFLAAVLLLMMGTGTFQAIVSIYIAAVILYCLQKVLAGDLKIGRTVVWSALICVLAVVLYFVINRCVQAATGIAADYTDSYIGWSDERGVLWAAFMSVANVARVSFAITIQDVSIYGGVVILVNTVLFIIWSVVTFFRAREKGKKGRILLLTVALVLSPFMIYILMGTYKTHGRMLLALPLVGAAQLSFILGDVWRADGRRWLSRAGKYLAVAVAAYCLWLNVRNMNAIYYYDYLRYQQDRVTANEVMHDVIAEGCDYHSKPIVFVGARVSDTAGFWESSDNLGIDGSFFVWNGGHIARIRELLVTEGYMTVSPTIEDSAYALTYTEQMSPWPGPGGIMDTDRCIIVYFSEPTEEWYQVNGLNPADYQ